MSERIEAAARARSNGYDSYPEPAKRSIRSEVEPLLEAADDADQKVGVVRVNTRDEATVEKVARVLFERSAIGGIEWESIIAEYRDYYRTSARLVLDALEGTR